MTIIQQPERFGLASGFSADLAFVNLSSSSESVFRSGEEQEEVHIFGVEQKSNAQMIADLLAKLPMPQQPQQQLQQPGPSAPPAMIPPPQPLLPQMTGYFRPPPGLELALGFENAAMSKPSLDMLSTMDDLGSLSEESLHSDVMAPVSEAIELALGFENAAMSKPSLDMLSTMDDLGSLSEESLHSDVMAPVSEAKMHRPGMTTVMVRNIPAMYTQEMLVSECVNMGTFDFLRLPRSGNGQSNLTYACINFVSQEHALAFQDQWHKKHLTQLVSRKPLNISFANVQGLLANLMQLNKKKTCEARQCQPIIIKNGQHLTLEQAWDVCGKRNVCRQCQPIIIKNGQHLTLEQAWDVCGKRNVW
eukprot:CAMPEP_0183599566 /NCGR_PEP_ID=MMETSP0371-20130417/179498_1 /TAXON_ID=268820 /ORGANISM="Peridinium aciculiferum, Strain PAER-2" /LENGTH=360 /DNA_ID=CAMNT_0025811635 /DNA_START=88 /DNA_END=1167 /DNA_ORIENTATION=-